MLKVLYQKLRLSSKGNLNHNNYSNLSKLQIRKVRKLDKVGRTIVQGIPALSIFALVGIIVSSLDLLVLEDKIYADDTMPLAASTNAMASLSIGGKGQEEQVVAGYNVTTYRAHTVTINASDIESYSLQIVGPSTLAGETDITGANNVIGSSLLDNTWGYSYGESTSVEAMTYKTLTTAGATIDTGTPTSGSVSNLSRNLVFAVKFGDTAVPGDYKANVTLLLTATPKQLATLGSVATLQEVTAEICDNTPIGNTQYTLRDARDNNTYTVAKLADGNCWMTQNLRLTGSRTLTSGDSSVSSNYTLPASLSAVSGGFSRNNFYASQVYYANNTTNGAYYSFTAATAGTGNSTLVSGDVPADICPKNWRLPNRSGAKSYDRLASAYNTSSNPAVLQQAPLNFVNAGAAYDGKFDTGMGRYWSRTILNSTTASYMKFNDTSVSPVNGYDRFGGCSVRCVADDTPILEEPKSFGGITTMQEMTSTICGNETVGATATLVDSRDGNSYAVRKHEDGNCWMTQNLRLTGSRTLTSSDSDVTTNYALPASNLANFNDTDTTHAVYLANASNGAYYTWCAATAGTCSNTSVNTSAASSVCPKGWKMPPSTGTKSFDTLVTTLGSAAGTLTNSTYNFNLAGRTYNNALNYVGERGYWWSSTLSGAQDAYSLYIMASSVNSRYGHDWRTGYSVRCVAK